MGKAWGMGWVEGKGGSDKMPVDSRRLPGIEIPANSLSGKCGIVVASLHE